MTTTPFDESVAQLVTGPHQQLLSAVALVGGQSYTLDVEDYEIDWTERRTPRTYARLTCAVPPQATLDVLDPRTYVRVAVTYGYLLASGEPDTDTIYLHLRSRRVRRPDDRLEMVSVSHEMLNLDQSASTTHPDERPPDLQTSDSASKYLASVLRAQLAEITAAADVVVLDEMNSPPTTVSQGDTWDAIEDASERQGFDVYDNGDLTIRFRPTVTDVQAVTAHTLTVGPVGTITDSTSQLDRDDWANWVVLQYRSATAPYVYTYGQAQVSAGPYAPANAGRRLLVEQRDGQPSQVQANYAADMLLRRLLSRARGYTINAVSAWWLRPGHTVTVKLPTGGQERHVVVGVVHKTGGTMTVITRLPDGVSTIGE